MLNLDRESVVANVLNCKIVVTEFKLQSRNYVHFQTKTLILLLGFVQNSQ